MAWYAYCLIEQKAVSVGTRARRPFPIQGLKGVNGSQVFAFPSGEFAVVVSEHIGADLTQRAACEHAHVISECFRLGTVLPLKFGTVFESDELLRHAVRANRKTFLDSVSQLRGKAEMHLKVTVKNPVLAHPRDGAADGKACVEYLTRLRQKAIRERDCQARARSVTMQMHKIFSPLQQDVVCKQVSSGALTLDIAHLIESASIAKYQSRLTAALKHLPDCQIALSGPWPPYHFMPGKVRTVSDN